MALICEAIMAGSVVVQSIGIWACASDACVACTSRSISQTTFLSNRCSSWRCCFFFCWVWSRTSTPMISLRQELGTTATKKS